MLAETGAMISEEALDKAEIFPLCICHKCLHLCLEGDVISIMMDKVESTSRNFLFSILFPT